MLLTTLVEMEERCRADAIASVGEGARRQRRLGRGGAGGGGGSGYDHDDHDHDHDDDDDDEDGGREGEDPFSKGLFLPEFIQVNRSLPRSFAPRRILFV